MANIDKVCKDCGRAFQFTNAEQDFYRKNNLADPKRCRNGARAIRQHWAAAKHKEGGECFECNPKLVRGVVTNVEHQCVACGRPIEKSGSQYPVVRAA
jgi:hypothetical protein